MRSCNTKNSDNIFHFKLNLFYEIVLLFGLAFCSYGIEQAGLKYMQLRKSQYFKKKLLKFVRFYGTSVFRCHNPKRVKLLTKLRLGLSHLQKHKLKHDFLNSLNPICSCGQDIETPTHLFHPCSNCSNIIFLNIIKSIDRNILDNNDLKNMESLLFGNSS